MTERTPDEVDPERPRGDKPFDREDGHFGQDYNARHEAAEGAKLPSGTVGAPPGRPNQGHSTMPDAEVIPPDNGKRASFDPRTGEVHGSGAGAGGGNPGEDFDSDAATGDGYPLTGGEHNPADR